MQYLLGDPNRGMFSKFHSKSLCPLSPMTDMATNRPIRTITPPATSRTAGGNANAMEDESLWTNTPSWLCLSDGASTASPPSSPLSLHCKSNMDKLTTFCTLIGCDWLNVISWSVILSLTVRLTVNPMIELTANFPNQCFASFELSLLQRFMLYKCPVSGHGDCVERWEFERYKEGNPLNSDVFPSKSLSSTQWMTDHMDIEGPFHCVYSQPICSVNSVIVNWIWSDTEGVEGVPQIMHPPMTTAFVCRRQTLWNRFKSVCCSILQFVSRMVRFCGFCPFKGWLHTVDFSNLYLPRFFPSPWFVCSRSYSRPGSNIRRRTKNCSI